MFWENYFMPGIGLPIFPLVPLWCPDNSRYPCKKEIKLKRKASDSYLYKSGYLQSTEAPSVTDSSNLNCGHFAFHCSNHNPNCFSAGARQVYSSFPNLVFSICVRLNYNPSWHGQIDAWSHWMWGRGAGFAIPLTTFITRKPNFFLQSKFESIWKFP